MKKLCIVILLNLLLASCREQMISKLDLSGTWTVCLDTADIGMREHWEGKLYKNEIILPGTTDDAGLGIPNSLTPMLEKPQMLHLTRKHSYIGPAWYTREIYIPENWEEKEFTLNLERVLWDTQVWIDERKVEGHEESLTTPHVYNLTPYIHAGKKHILTIRVDNRKRYDISERELAHAYTEETQIKWNGILGDIYIKATERITLQSIQLYPDVENRKVKAVVGIKNNLQDTQFANLSLRIEGEKDGISYGNWTQKLTVLPGVQHIELECKLPKNAPLWDEFSPYIYKVLSQLDLGGEQVSKLENTFGLRNIQQNGDGFLINGKPLFLRGTLECCVFPLTGTPPMDEEGWEKVFDTAHAYGLNHLRFHSWCPPEVAFRVADKMGFYLQIELPLWSGSVGNSEDMTAFLREEAKRIIQNYGNHPSFCFWSLGNELQSDFNLLASILKELKRTDNRHLYTTTSFTFEKGHGLWPEPDDDYLITQITKKGWVRGQGVFNQQEPAFDQDYRTSVEGMDVPLVSHEIGQYAVYPDLSEINKYTGTLLPLNFMAVRDDLEKKGLLDKAPLYLQASGKLAAILYKEEIERALKTKGVGGIQLLDLHDFPGQGTALVGLLNAFWESKGIISDKEFREFCSPIVPLLRYPKAVYVNSETFNADIELCNYSNKELKNCKLIWKIQGDGKLIGTDTLKSNIFSLGRNIQVGTIKCRLNDIQKAQKLEVSVSLDGTPYQNRWNIWVYPKTVEINWGDVKYTRSYAEALDLLNKGEKVLFNPDWKKMKGVEGKFVPVFWSPIHFTDQAGTMGVLCNPHHPALADFPTDMHTNWQWWDLNVHSTTLITDSLQGGSPIVEMVDNFVNNRRLSSLYEGKVGNGKLILATFDLYTDMQRRPVARQMLKSILNYMNSTNFNPSTIQGFDKINIYF